RVVEQMLEARVDERRGDDPPESTDIAGIDAVGVEPVRVERVDRLDEPHQHDDRCQQQQSLAGVAQPLIAVTRLIPQLQPIAHPGSLAQRAGAGRAWAASKPADQSSSTARATASARAIRSAIEPAWMNSSGVWAPPPRGPSPSSVRGIAEAKWLAS